DVVKLEGAGRMVSRVRAIAESNVGVMAHIGLTPQSATRLGGFRAQGRTAAAALALVDDALALEEAGAFALVLEAVPAPVAARITQALAIPTIGIAAGPACDGQVLVWHDLLGLYAGRTPRFVKRYAELAGEISAALAEYVADVRSGAFPEDKHTYGIADEELARFEAALSEREQQRGDGERRKHGRGRTRPRPGVHRAHADHEQGRRPGDEREHDPRVGVAPDRREDERERERDAGVREHVAGAPVRPERAERAGGAVEDRAEEPVGGGAGDPAGEQDPDGEQDPVVAGRGARGERERGPDEPDHEQHRLRPVGGRL